MQNRPRRSALYMPASNAKAIDKARTLDCDVVILDLEDAVAPDAKEVARAQAMEAVRAAGFGRRQVVIRCNGLDTPWGADDLKTAAQAGPRWPERTRRWSRPRRGAKTSCRTSLTR